MSIQPQTKRDEAELEQATQPEEESLPTYTAVSSSNNDGTEEGPDAVGMEAPLYEEVVLLEPQLPTGPISLTLEGINIYASFTPGVPFYRLPRLMPASANLLLDRCIPAMQKPDGRMRKARTLSLYQCMGVPATRDVEIKGMKQECYALATVRRRNTLFGSPWEVSVDNEVLLSFRDRRWKDFTKTVVAEEGKYKAGGKDFMEIKEGVSPKLRDLLVACWCARLCREASMSQWASPLGQVLVASGGESQTMALSSPRRFSGSVADSPFLS
ncbi:MAG: hypothetical protein M1814_003882 [Vezdaea aestivalis]|nr:MAG: hypothetical protein M1814_003882 [Vezdaea aestivalis]